MNISIVSASSCRELTFAVEIKNRLLEKSTAIYTQLSFHTYTAPSTHTHTHTHTRTHTHTHTYIYIHILLQAVQSGVRHILKEEKTRMASFLCAFCLYSE